MARLHIDLPEKFLFKTELTIRASDLNYGGHVGNDTMLTFLQEARIRFYRQLGFKDEVGFEGSVGQIIADASIQYKSESFFGDVLIIELAVSDFNKYGFDMFYRVTNKESLKEVARAKTGIICFDYAKRKVVSIPVNLLQTLKSHSTK